VKVHIRSVNTGEVDNLIADMEMVHRSMLVDWSMVMVEDLRRSRWPGIFNSGITFVLDHLSRS
jgi:hypothetical protein